MPLLCAALLGLPVVVASAGEQHCPAEVLAVRGVNPTYAAISGYLTQAAAAHDVPVQVLKAIAFQESGWRPFQADGKPTLSGSTDPVCGVGLMQVTWDAGMDGERLAGDVAFNAMEGARILREKWEDGLDQTHPQPTGFDPDDPDVLENWYAAICRYNGCPFSPGGDEDYVKPVARMVRSAFQAGVPNAVSRYMPPAGFTLPSDADPAYAFPGGFQAQHDPVEQFVFYDSTTGAVTKTAPGETHLRTTAFPGYGVAYGPGGPGVYCGFPATCQWWRPAEGEGVAGWAHWTNSVDSATGSAGVRVTWMPPATGQYDVRAFVPAVGDSTLGKATYHLGSSLTTTIDQDGAKDVWAYLGRATLSSSAPLWLGDASDVAGRRIVADAVRFSAVSKLAIGASATTVSYGRTTSIAMRVSQVGGTGLAGRKVTLERRRVGVLGWTKVGTYTTGSTGRVRVVQAPTANTYYRLSNASDATTAGAAPVTLRVNVRPVVRAVLSKTSVPRGTPVTVSATVTPSHAGQQVVLQRYYSGAWRDALSATLSSTGRASWRFAKPAGTYRYRVYKPADSDHVAAWSATLTLTAT